jgi:hypothetical protein
MSFISDIKKNAAVAASSLIPLTVLHLIPRETSIVSATNNIGTNYELG